MQEKKEIISEERRTKDLQSIERLLQPFARKMLGKKAFAEADVLLNWKDIAGEEMASFCQPVQIDFKKGERTGGVLRVEAAGGAFALEVQLRSRFLINKVNTFFGYEAVKEIKIIQNPAVAKNLIQPIYNSEKKLVTDEEETYIKSLSEGIKHPELEKILQKLGRSIAADNKRSDEI